MATATAPASTAPTHNPDNLVEVNGLKMYFPVTAGLFVQKKIAENVILMPTSAAQSHLDYATALRRNYRYREAYGELCLAYQTLGEDASARSR